MKNYTLGTTPQSAHEDFKRDWKQVERIPMPMRGRVIVEFGPYASDSFLWTPEAAHSYTAIVVNDWSGELAPGWEVAIASTDGTNFEHEGRILTIINKSDILLFEERAAA